jgi:hypothetical protein
MTDDVIAHYRDLLAAEPAVAEALCLTWAQGRDQDGFIRAFGGDPAARGHLTLAEAAAEQVSAGHDRAPAVLLVAPAGDWVVGLEVNGFQGSRPEVLRAASAGGRALSVYWNVNGANRVGYAVRGPRLVSFEATRPQERLGRDPHALDRELAGLPFGGQWRAAALALAERVTGIRLDRAWLGGRYRRAVLRPVPGDLIPAGFEDDPALDDPEISAILAAPTADKLPRITGYVAGMLVRDANLDDLPVASRVLAAVRAGAGADPGLGAEVAALADEYRREVHGSPRLAGLAPDAAAELSQLLFRQMHALKGLAGALDPDPARAAWETCWAAGYALTAWPDRLRLAVLERCMNRATRPAT